MAPAQRFPRSFLALLAVLFGATALALGVRTLGGRSSSKGPPTSAGASVRPAGGSSAGPHPSGDAQGAASQDPYPIPGYLLIADRGNSRILLVDSRKRVVWSYPRAGERPSFPFFFDDDTFFGALGSNFSVIITNEEDQQTIEMLSFPGRRVLWTYGHPKTPGSGFGYLHTPDDAYLLPDGTRTVADVHNCRILFISPAKRIVRQIGTTGVCTHDPPRSLALPNGDTPLPDGSTLVTEITGSWIDDISKTGKLLWSVHAPVKYPSDAQYLGRGRFLLADYSPVGHVLIMNTHGRVLWEYGPSYGAGALSFPSLALMLPNGLVAVNDDARHRVVLIDPRANRIVWQYGLTDVPGRGPGRLRRPDGMDFLPFDVAMSTPAIRQVVAGTR